MNKAHLLKKTRKLTLVYMAVLIAMSAYIIIKLMSLYFFSEIIDFRNLIVSEFDTSFFTRIVHSINPSIAYYQDSEQVDTHMVKDRMSALYGYNVPLMTFIMGQGDYVYDTASENYPNLQQRDDNYENDLEHYDHNENFFNLYTLEEQTPKIHLTNAMLDQLRDFTSLKANLYTFDASINPTKSDFPVDKFLKTDMTIDKTKPGPKVLIYHTHSQESFSDSRKGVKEDTVVGVGDELASILEKTYNIEVLHHRKEYDIINGKLDRNKAYQLIEAPLKKLIADNPTIEVLIDIHRDGVKGNLRLVKDINHKPTANIMFFNGLAQYSVMPNPYVSDNLAFSFQMQLKANELYPGFTRKIYLKGYRYNLHLKPKSLLIEVGAQTSTVREAKNAMEPLAKILYEVIK